MRRYTSRGWVGHLRVLCNVICGVGSLRRGREGTSIISLFCGLSWRTCYAVRETWYGLGRLGYARAADLSALGLCSVGVGIEHQVVFFLCKSYVPCETCMWRYFGCVGRVELLQRQQKKQRCTATSNSLVGYKSKSTTYILSYSVYVVLVYLLCYKDQVLAVLGLCWTS